MNKRKILIGLAVVVAAFLLYNFFFKDEEEAVRKQFEVLAESTSKEPGEQPLIAIQKAGQIGSLFADICRLKVTTTPFSGEYTPKEIIDRTIMARASFAQATIKFYDVNIDFPIDGVANVVATVRLTGKSSREKDVTDTHEIEAILKKIDGDWLFTELKVVEVLEK